MLRLILSDCGPILPSLYIFINNISLIVLIALLQIELLLS